MVLNLDTIIFITFLLVNLAVGLFYSKGVNTVKEYAIGNRDFSVNSIAVTVMATYIGAGFITAALNESYRQGLYFIIPILGEPLMLVVTGYFLIPRMSEFLGKTSVAEAMGDLYGPSIRIITAISGMFKSAGIVAFQFVIASQIMEVFFNTDSMFALALSAIIIVLYSSLGGIKAVTFTDILQFAFIGISIPLICLSIWKTTSLDNVSFILLNDSIFDYKNILSTHNPRIIAMTCLFLYFILPPIDSAYFQRISMSQGVNQAKKSFIIAGFVGGAILLVVCWSGILIYSSNSNLEPNSMLVYILERHTYSGFKGLAAAGIIAAIMSTADSYLNSASILACDFIKTITGHSVKPEKELLLLRIATIVIGIMAFVMAYYADSLIGILVMSVTFYVPIVSVPLLLAIFGFRSNTKVVLMGMLAGGVTALLWSDFYSHVQFDGFGKEVIEETNEAIPAMLANLIVFTIAHLICGTPKGHHSLPNSPLKSLNVQEKQKFYNVFKTTITNFSLSTFYQNHFLKHESLYFLSGLFSFVSIISTTYLASTKTQNLYIDLLNIIYPSALIASTVLMTYPIWSPRYQSDKFIMIFWTIVAPYIFVFIPTAILIISNFEQFQIVLLLINMMIFISLVKWQMSLVMIPFSIYLSIKCCEFFIQGYSTTESYIEPYTNLKVKTIYTLVLISGIIIAFIRPKQKAEEISNERNKHFTNLISEQEDEIFRLTNLKSEFLRNLQHETNTPLTGICTMSQAISELYDQLTDTQRKLAINIIAKSSTRLISYVNNLIDVSKLVYIKSNTRMQYINISDLVDTAITRCQKLYIPTEEENNRDFILNIEPNILVKCDTYYINRAIENIIINSIQYCKEGIISITLVKNPKENNIILQVKDTGIGIPQEELAAIFELFVTSTKTTTPAGGRGVGLTLVKKVAELHEGTVTVESNNTVEGCLFTLTLPLK